MTRRLARGDERAWGWLHDHYFGTLHAAAVARGASPSDAADLVPRTYLPVLRHAKRFRTERDLRCWLCCLLRCETIDAARRGKRRSLLMEKFQHRENLHATTAPPPPRVSSSTFRSDR
jgi:DNA-directed RNA polymerase specialized sigma24 family protein